MALTFDTWTYLNHNNSAAVCPIALKFGGGCITAPRKCWICRL